MQLDFGPKQSGWLINQLGVPQFFGSKIDIYPHCKRHHSVQGRFQYFTNEIEVPSASLCKLRPGVLTACHSSAKEDSQADDVGVNGQLLTFSALAASGTRY